MDDDNKWNTVHDAIRRVFSVTFHKIIYIYILLIMLIKIMILTILFKVSHAFHSYCSFYIYWNFYMVSKSTPLRRSHVQLSLLQSDCVSMVHLILHQEDFLSFKTIRWKMRLGGRSKWIDNGEGVNKSKPRITFRPGCWGCQ